MSREIKPFDWNNEPDIFHAPVEAAEYSSEGEEQFIEVQYTEDTDQPLVISTEKVALVTTLLGGVGYLVLRSLVGLPQPIAIGGGLVTTAASGILLIRALEKEGFEL
jgi:hypothetical protein